MKINLLIKIVLLLSLLTILCSSKSLFTHNSKFVGLILFNKDSSITFKVDDVILNDTLIEEVKYEKCVENRINKKYEATSNTFIDTKVIQTYGNGFIYALNLAYDKHKPLIISPDMIWLLICQGFSNHIRLNPDIIKNYIKTGKEENSLTVFRPEFRKNRKNDWQKVISMFSNDLSKQIEEDLYSNIVINFSTTTPETKIAFQITLLESFSNHFSARLFTGCGIYSITLEGKTEDWIKIKENSIKLKKFGLENWINNLIPILDQFIYASEGQIDTEFWKKIYKYKDKYSPSYVTGWIVKFFPYYLKYYQEVRNETEEYAYKKLEPNPFFEGQNYLQAKLEPSDFPEGLSSFEFKWTDLLLFKKYDMCFKAGFIGIHQNKDDFSLRPIVTWVLFDNGKPDIIQYDN